MSVQSDPLKEFLIRQNRYSLPEIDLILESTERENFTKGEFLVREGAVSNKCYLVIKGSVRQFQLRQDMEKTSAFFLEGDPIIMYSSYLEEKASEYSLQCLEDTILVSGAREKEKQMHLSHPLLEYLTHHFLKEDFRKAEQYIALLNIHPPEERYLWLLQNQPQLITRIPLIHISSYLGITPESLSRIRKRILVNKH